MIKTQSYEFEFLASRRQVERLDRVVASDEMVTDHTVCHYYHHQYGDAVKVEQKRDGLIICSGMMVIGTEK
jgi:hypothetical protein